MKKSRKVASRSLRSKTRRRSRRRKTPVRSRRRKTPVRSRRRKTPVRSRRRKTPVKSRRMKLKKRSLPLAIDTVKNYLRIQEQTGSNWDKESIKKYKRGVEDCGNYCRSKIICQNLIKSLKNIYETNGKQIGGGTYAGLWMTHYDKDPFNNKLMRIQKLSNLSEEAIKDEVELTMQMSEEGHGPKVYGIFFSQNNMYSLVQKYDSDGSAFVKQYPEKLVKYIECLFQRYDSLIDLGWLCYDLKPQNTLVYTDEKKENCKSVVLTDFGADFCRKQADTVITELVNASIASSKDNAKRQLATLLTTMTIYQIICFHNSAKRDEVLGKMETAYKNLNITKADFQILQLFNSEGGIQFLDPIPGKGISLYTTLEHYLKNCNVLSPFSEYLQKMKTDLGNCSSAGRPTWLTKKTMPYTCKDLLEIINRLEKSKQLSLNVYDEFSNEFDMPELIQFIFIFLLGKIGIGGLSDFITNKTLKELLPQEAIKQMPVQPDAGVQPNADFKTAKSQFSLPPSYIDSISL